MKKFYSILAMLIASVFAFNVSAETVSFEITNPEGCVVKFNGVPQDISSGKLTITYNGASYSDGFEVIQNDGWKTTMYYNGTDYSGNPQKQYCDFYDGACSRGLYPYMDNMVFYIDNKQLTYDSQFILNVDNASSVSASFDGKGDYLRLQNGENVIKYNSFENFDLVLHDYSKSLYSVTADGQPVEWSPQYDGAWIIPLYGTQRVDIQVSAPAKECKVKIRFVNAGTEGYLQGVTLKTDQYEYPGTTIAPEVYLSDSFTVMSNQYLSFRHNYDSKYTFKSQSVNGENYSYAQSDFKITDDTEIVYNIEMTKENTLTVNFTGNTDGLRLMVANSEKTLTEGQNVFTYFPSSYGAYANIEVKQGFEIKSITLNGNVVENPRSFSISDNDVLNLNVGEKVYTEFCSVYLNKTDLQYFNFQNNKGESYNLKEGYNVVGLSVDEMPFNVHSSTEVSFEYYLNDTKVEQVEYQYKFPATNGSAIKLFYGATPEKVDVEFFGNCANSVVVKKDIVANCNTAKTTNCFAGTQFDIIPDGAPIEVEVNGVKVPAVDGKHTFVANENSRVEIGAPGTVGVAGVEAATTNAPVFNLQGVKVANSLESLPAGFYIVNGKKVVKK